LHVYTSVLPPQSLFQTIYTVLVVADGNLLTELRVGRGYCT
jgi:hypothetical protein